MERARLSIPPGGHIVAVGSRVTCDPPPTDTDEDYLVYVRNLDQAARSLMEYGFSSEGDTAKMDEYIRMNETAAWRFRSLRMGHVNYILTDSAFLFERFLTASHVAKTLNLLDKKDRIMVFEAIRGGSFARDFHPEMGSIMGDAAAEGKIARNKYGDPEVIVKLQVAVMEIEENAHGTPF